MKTKDITYVAFGVAALIAGGFLVLTVSRIMPFPGVKFMLMAPFISMMMYILSVKIENRYAILYIGLVFAGIMTLFNIVMGISIVTTTVLTQLSILWIKKIKERATVGGCLYAMYTGLTALVFSKYLIGGVFEMVSYSWIIIVTLICLLFGSLGIIFGNKLLKHLNSIRFK